MKSIMAKESTDSEQGVASFEYNPQPLLFFASNSLEDLANMLLENFAGKTMTMKQIYIDWVIVGGESGPHARPMQKEWVIDIRDQCQQVNVPFFFKQWGGRNKKREGRTLEGRTWDDWPVSYVGNGV